MKIKKQKIDRLVWLEIKHGVDFLRRKLDKLTGLNLWDFGK